DPDDEVLQAINRRGRNMGKSQPGNALQLFLVSATHDGPARPFLRDDVEHELAEQRLQLVHLAIDAGHDHFDFVLDAEVLQQVDSGFQVRIGIGKATTFAAMKKLRRMETKHRDIAEVSNADRVDLRLKGVRRIVDHTQPVPFGDSPDSMDVAGNSVDVNT